MPPQCARVRRAPHRRMSPSGGASGALAFRRSAAALAKALTPRLSSRPALHGTRNGIDRSSSGQRAPRGPVVVPAGRGPGAARGGLQNRARAPRSLHISDRIRNAPFGERASALLLGGGAMSIIITCDDSPVDLAMLFALRIVPSPDLKPRIRQKLQNHRNCAISAIVHEEISKEGLAQDCSEVFRSNRHACDKRV